MTIREKIEMYCEEQNLTITEFAATLDESRQNLNNMISGKSRMNSEIFLKIRKNHPLIDLNKLIDDSVEDYFMVSEPKATYGQDELSKQRSADIAKVIKILERYK